MEYMEFLKGKIDVAEDTGFKICPEEVNPALKPHQRDAVVWAVQGGRANQWMRSNAPSWATTRRRSG